MRGLFTPGIKLRPQISGARGELSIEEAADRPQHIVCVCWAAAESSRHQRKDNKKKGTRDRISHRDTHTHTRHIKDTFSLDSSSVIISRLSLECSGPPTSKKKKKTSKVRKSLQHGPERVYKVHRQLRAQRGAGKVSMHTLLVRTYMYYTHGPTSSLQFEGKGIKSGPTTRQKVHINDSSTDTHLKHVC